MVKRAHDIVARCKVQTHYLYENVRKDALNLNLNEDFGKELVKSLIDNIAKGSSNSDAILDLEYKGISEFEKIFSLLKLRKGTWEVQNSQIVFTRDSDLNAFNSYVTAIQDLTNEEESIQKQRYETAKNKLN